MANYKSKKTRVMTIVHGKSEYCICSSIKSNLKIKHEIYAKKRGRNSIQINDLENILNNNIFGSFKKFITEYPDIEIEKKKLINFKLFIIMDVDDCTLENKNRFIRKEMFAKHWMKDNIIPIYNDPDLEKTMKDIKIEVNKKRDYIEIFPTNEGDLDLTMAKDFLKKLKKCRCTNLEEYVEYCIDIVEENLK
ncbi:hypothetical protein WG909_12960 [Peptostreptococcaceae bacterium AGR-M142]